MNSEVLDAIRKKGILLEKEVFDLVASFEDKNSVDNFLEQLVRISGKRMITMNVLTRNMQYIQGIVDNLKGGDKQLVEKVILNLGVQVEIRTEKRIEQKETNNLSYKVFYANTSPDKKLEVKDFVGHFRARFQQLQRILMQRAELQSNLVSIGKISSDRAALSIIGIVTEKRITKNKNMMIKFEDLTGEIKALIKPDREDVFAKAEELQLDDIVGVKGSGNKDFLFVHDIFYPDSFKTEKVKFEQDVSIAFLSDMHCGSDRHLEKSMNNFLEWLNSDDENAKKIRYIFIVGDNVDGVGIFPGQEEVLRLKSMHEQYELLASYLKRVPKNVTMFMCPGQHDATRVAEPQPIISKRYAPQLYEIENLILVTNPTNVKLIEGDKEFKVLMYHGASLHNFINEIKYLRLMKAHKCPARAVEELLKRRHLAPTHSEVVYIPNADCDPMVISEVPDILCTGEVHRLDIRNYNGVIIITGSCWQSQTPFEEKVGNVPDPAKVPVFNLKTRELKIFDFGHEDEVKRE
jgi:DNA polymerase II small subunit